MNALWAFVKKNYSVLPLLCDYDNLIVVRAFTKLFAIPGVRLGYMLSKNDTNKTKGSKKSAGVERVCPGTDGRRGMH